MNKEILLEFVIDFASPIPVYEQIKNSIKHVIAKKLLVAKEPLPSIRELATFLKINPNTVARAYRDLSQDKIISGRAGLGFWVDETAHIEENKLQILKNEFLRFIEKAISMGFTHEHIRTVFGEFFGENK